MASRNRNIFIRKETEYSCSQDNPPVFAHVLGYHDTEDRVVYEVNWPTRRMNDKWQWHDGRSIRVEDTDFYYVEKPTIYVKTLEDFLKLFSPDVFDYYERY